jgi:hypothetical protein
MRCRWEDLRTTVFDPENINTYIDSVAGAMNEGPQQRNFFQWPILGYYVWPNPYPYPEDFDAEIGSLKSWISERIAWLDANIPGNCPYSGIRKGNGKLLSCTVSPNPCSEKVTLTIVSGEPDPVIIRIYNIYGSLVKTLEGQTLIPGKNQFTVDLSDLASGFYVAEARGTKGTARNVFIKQ